MKKQYPTVFHESCLNNPNIIVSAGKIGYQIDLDPQTLIEFTKENVLTLLSSLYTKTSHNICVTFID